MLHSLGTGDLFFLRGGGVKQAGHLAGNSPSPSAKVKSVGAVASLMAHGFLPAAV